MFNPQPKKGMPAKKEKKPLKRTRIKYKPKSTGQVDVFEEIASEREWVDFVKGTRLGELKATQFAHVLSKALNKFPKFIAYKKNIVLLTDENHHLWDKGSRAELRKDPDWKNMFDLEEELKQEYKQLYGKSR